MEVKKVDNIWRKIRFTSIALNNQFGDYSLYLKRSDLYFDLQLYRLCLDDVDRAISLHPDRTDAILRKSNAYIALEMFNEAEQTLLKYLQRKPPCDLVQQQLQKVRYESIKRIGFKNSVCTRIAQVTDSVDSAIDRALSMDQDELEEEEGREAEEQRIPSVNTLRQLDNLSRTHFVQMSCPESTVATEQNRNKAIAAAQHPQPLFTQPSCLAEPLKPVSMEETSSSSLNNTLDTFFSTTPSKRIFTDDRYSPRKPSKVKRSDVNINSFLDDLINCPSFHEKIAETINKVYWTDTTVGKQESPQISLPIENVQPISAPIKDPIADVLHEFLDSITDKSSVLTDDPIFNEISILFDPKKSDSQATTVGTESRFESIVVAPPSIAMGSYELDDYCPEPLYLVQDADVSSVQASAGNETFVKNNTPEMNENLETSENYSDKVNTFKTVNYAEKCTAQANEPLLARPKFRKRVRKKFPHVKPYPDIVKNLMKNLD